jgi:hypothetical protein
VADPLRLVKRTDVGICHALLVLMVGELFDFNLNYSFKSDCLQQHFISTRLTGATPPGCFPNPPAA